MKSSPAIALLASASVASAALLPLHRRQDVNPKPITSTQNGVNFEVEIQIGDQTFNLIPDTGSSDVWVPVPDFTCVDKESDKELPQKDCNYPSTYQVSDSTEYIHNQTFGVQYGTGISTGKVAYADVTLNGITVEHQKIGLVDRTNDVSDGLGSGILGLGFPALTSAHPGTKQDNSSEGLLANRAVYDPLFVSMYKKKLVEPWYSFAIERPVRNLTTSAGGWLGLGELPPVPHSDDWAVKKIEIQEGIPKELTGGKSEITLMTLTVDGISWGSKGGSKYTNSTPFQAVVDTGNNMNVLPNELAEQINSRFEPKGKLNDEGRYVVDCNATAPDFAVTLDKHTFWHKNPEDMIFHDTTGYCYSSVGPTGEGEGFTLNFLGDAFLRNVVSVYDFGKEEMRFAERTNSGGSGGNGQPKPPTSGVSANGPMSGLWTTAAVLAVAMGVGLA